MKKKQIIAILLAAILLVCFGCDPAAQAMETDNISDSGAETKMTLTIVESIWSGWSKEQPEPIKYTYEDISEGTVVYDRSNYGFGSIKVAEVTADGIRLSLDNSIFIESNGKGTIDLTADPITSITVMCGEEKELDTPTLDGGVILTICVGTSGDPAQYSSKVANASNGYRLIVNGKEVPIDSFYRASAKGEEQLMIPMTALFRGIGYETEIKGDTVEMRNGERTLILDLNAHTLVDTDKTWDNYLTLAPGDTGDAFKRKRSGGELWVCTTYVGNAFQLLGMPMQFTYDESSNEMRVTIENAEATPEGNPYFTCTGTEYGPYPIIPYQQREAEARVFLSEHRELLERAATELLNGSDIRIFSGEAYMRNDAGKYEPIDAATLSDDLKALVRLSKEADIDFYVCNPDPVFTEDAAAYFNVNFPMAIDETMYTDPGTLYYVALIYTTNTEEQITESYRHDVKSLDGNWFIETYFYAY